MASVLALLSKSFYEANVRVDDREPEIGDVAPLDRYFSSNKRLTTLADGGSLYLVTVRPPDEQLLLVAVLPEPVFEGKWWRSERGNQVPVTDVSHLVPRLEFDNGKGISPKPGRLGMSLQTPRILNDDDVALFASATRGGGSAAVASAAAPSAPLDLADRVAAALEALDQDPDDARLRASAARLCAMDGQSSKSAELLGSFIHLNAHEPGALPCLCKRCFDPALGSADTDGSTFVRGFAVEHGRVLYYWMPEVLSECREHVASDVAARLRKRLESPEAAG